MRHMLPLLVVAVLLSCCAPGHGLRPLPGLSGGEYHLAPGDLVRIITYGEDPLTGEFRVSDQGSIALPLAGNVEASDRTPHQLEDAITTLLKKRGMLAWIASIAVMPGPVSMNWPDMQWLPAMLFRKINGHVPRDHFLEAITGKTPFCTKLPVKSAIDINKPAATICQPK